MQIYRYLITLHDSLYYAREGLDGAITPPLIHPTAINGALATAMNCNSENQPFLISEANGGRNKPRYKNSCLCNAFYATAASVRGEVRYRNEIAKAENDGFMEVHKRSANKTKNKKRIDIREQPLRFTRLHFLAPETIFEGFMFLYDDTVKMPSLIRLGSFRAPAGVQWELAHKWKSYNAPITVDHPVDPLVTKVQRGVFSNLLPYGIVRNPVVDSAYKAFFPKSQPLFIAKHRGALEESRNKSATELKHAQKCISALRSGNLEPEEKSELLLRALKTLMSIWLYVHQKLSDQQLSESLSAVEHFDELRHAVAEGGYVSETGFSSVYETCEGLLRQIQAEESENDEAVRADDPVRNGDTILF